MRILYGTGQGHIGLRAVLEMLSEAGRAARCLLLQLPLGGSDGMVLLALGGDEMLALDGGRTGHHHMERTEVTGLYK
jgi:hypothetical protein